jgi:hypothetical protein
MDLEDEFDTYPSGLTQKEIQFIKKRHDDGWTHSQISGVLGFGEDSLAVRRTIKVYEKRKNAKSHIKEKSRVPKQK